MERPHGWLKAAAAAVVVLAGVQVAAAQTTLTITPDVVTPGGTVTAIVAGPPGQFFAIIGSSVGSGMSYGGVALAVGPDFVILAQGVLNGSGGALVGLVPPFQASVLDRYYLQAATSPSASFLPLSVSPGRVVRNGDLVTGPAVFYTESREDIPLPTTLTSILHLDLPAGSYVIHATVAVNNLELPRVPVLCALQSPRDHSVWTLVSLHTLDGATLPVSLATTMLLSGRVELHCHSNAVGATALASHRQMTALTVARVTVQ
jgi:hypothetical protein